MTNVARNITIQLSGTKSIALAEISLNTTGGQLRDWIWKQTGTRPNLLSVEDSTAFISEDRKLGDIGIRDGYTVGWGLGVGVLL